MALSVLLILNTVQLVQIKNEISYLRNDYSSTYNTLSNRITNIERSMYNQADEIRDILTAQEALFAATDVQVAYQNKKLAITVHAVPKALRNGETIWASIATGNEIVTQQLDQNGYTTIMLEPTVASFVPSLQIKSSAGMQQQVLDEISTASYICADVYAFWNDASTEEFNFNLGRVLEFYLQPYQDTLPFTIEEIADIYLIVHDTGTIRGNIASETVAIPIDKTSFDFTTTFPDGERVEVVAQENKGNKAFAYYADLSEFTERADEIDYEVHLVVETTYGLTYSTAESEPIATFWSDKSTLHQSANAPSLSPIFETK